jgi:nucleoid-associated protein YgaU
LEDEMTAVVSYLPTQRIAPARPATPRLRLTRRGRAVVTALAVVPLLIIGLVLGLGAGGAVATHDAASGSLTWVTVDAGQSLWDIAAEIAPAEDPREFAAQVAAFNQLDSAVIQPGQELAIPPQYVD